MKSCPECHNPMRLEKIVLTYTQDGVQLEIRDVPAWVCSVCGKQLVTGEVASQVSHILDNLKQSGALEEFRADLSRFRQTVSHLRSAHLELVYT